LFGGRREKLNQILDGISNLFFSCLLYGMGGKEEEGRTGIGRKEGRDLLK
jgi:hypothetical protein